MFSYIDTHAHLYDEQFDEDRNEVISAAVNSGVTKMLLPNCNHSTVEGMMQLSKTYPENCFPMMGLHPCYVKEDYKKELTIIEQYLTKENFYAIGEIGLDLYWDKSFLTHQIEALNIQIDWAIASNLPIVLHTRSSLNETIEIIRKKQKGNLKGVFHCFSGTIEEASAIIDLGFYLGVGGVVTFKKNELKETLKHVDLKHILLETDSPYLSPTPYRGKRNQSAYIPLIAKEIADIKESSLQEVAKITTQNAINLFNL